MSDYLERLQQLSRLQQIRHLVWDLYIDPSFEKMQILTHLCDQAIDVEVASAKENL